ncbi:hypothetical protein ACI2KT_33885 [Ensifer adhaerens]|uniref:hypothetical protein n=1 Tax=Ensifer TaxID=106591 RepID=UPI00177D76E7|nr:hypothetical protein [Ensifer sp. ENS08]MBD9570778.1 hypothetical protein [Ensifer sp. ENS08]
MPNVEHDGKTKLPPGLSFFVVIWILLAISAYVSVEFQIYPNDHPKIHLPSPLADGTSFTQIGYSDFREEMIGYSDFRAERRVQATRPR